MAQVTANAALPVRNSRPNHLVVVKDFQQIQQNHKVFNQQVIHRQEKKSITLTKRGRRVVLFLILIPVAIFFLLIGTKIAQATDNNSAQTTQTVVVKSGQSLWDVAVSINSDSDPRETIWIIQQLNDMKTSEVLAGQELVVPVFN